MGRFWKNFTGEIISFSGWESARNFEPEAKLLMPTNMSHVSWCADLFVLRLSVPLRRPGGEGAPQLSQFISHHDDVSFFKKSEMSRSLLFATNRQYCIHECDNGTQ